MNIKVKRATSKEIDELIDVMETSIKSFEAEYAAYVILHQKLLQRHILKLIDLALDREFGNNPSYAQFIVSKQKEIPKRGIDKMVKALEHRHWNVRTAAEILLEDVA